MIKAISKDFNLSNSTMELLKEEKQTWLPRDLFYGNTTLDDPEYIFTFLVKD